MYIIKFGESYDTAIEVGRTENEEKFGAIIKNFLKSHNYKSSPYNRYWETNGITTVDFGSWSTFFYIEKEGHDNGVQD